MPEETVSPQTPAEQTPEVKEDSPSLAERQRIERLANQMAGKGFQRGRSNDPSEFTK